VRTPGSALPKTTPGVRTRTASASGVPGPFTGGRGVLTTTQSRVPAQRTLRASAPAPAPTPAPAPAPAPVRRAPQRASFKPRPSVEQWAPAPGVGAGVPLSMFPGVALPPGAPHWPGAGAGMPVNEEDED
jgi:hypothetical protein